MVRRRYRKAEFDCGARSFIQRFGACQRGHWLPAHFRWSGGYESHFAFVLQAAHARAHHQHVHHLAAGPAVHAGGGTFPRHAPARTGGLIYISASDSFFNIRLANRLFLFYFSSYRQMSYFWGTGREPPTKRINYVSNRTLFPRWLRPFRSIGHHRPRNCEGHFRRSCTQGAWRQTRR